MKVISIVSFLFVFTFSCAQKETQTNYKRLDKMEIATLGSGCFWCVEAVFQELKGVESVESGYSGGSVKNPSYKEVCNGTTGHAEVVQVTFDPEIISFEEILEVFLEYTRPNYFKQTRK